MAGSAGSRPPGRRRTPSGAAPRRPCALCAHPTAPYVTLVHPVRRLVVLSAAVLAVAACVENPRGVLEVTEGADSVQVLTGITDTAFVRNRMASVPVVVVKDTRGFRMPGARVTFVTPGPSSGSVIGGEVRTDSLGRASPGGWIAGPDSGTDSLIAFVIGSPGARATRAVITAPVIDPCNRPLPYTLGTSITGTLSGRGCVTFDSSLVQPYRVSVPAMGVYRFTVTSGAFDSYVEVTRGDGFPVAIFDGDGRVNAEVRVALPPGAFGVRAGALGQRRGVGQFTLSSGPATLPTSCDRFNPVVAYLVPGTAVSTDLSANDCTLQFNFTGIFNGQAPVKVFPLFVPPNQTIVVRLASTSVDALLVLASPGLQQQIGRDDNSGGGTNALLSFSAAAIGQPGGALVWVIATSKGQNGPITISVDGPGP